MIKVALCDLNQRKEVVGRAWSAFQPFSHPSPPLFLPTIQVWCVSKSVESLLSPLRAEGEGQAGPSSGTRDLKTAAAAAKASAEAQSGSKWLYGLRVGVGGLRGERREKASRVESGK